MDRFREFVLGRGVVAAMLACLAYAPVVVGQVQVAGELFVDLDAADPTAGTEVWANNAPQSIGDFLVVGVPVAEEVDGKKAVTFNLTAVQDAYQSEQDAPAGLIGPDPTRSIEAWVYNPVIDAEETILAWGNRGGPNGTNMSFNYGSNGAYGAIGHWGGDGPDIGWNNAGGAPAAGQWHYLAYTYDGTTTRVYADGCLIDTTDCATNTEELGLGAINTFGPSKITLAAQLEPGGITLTPGLGGTLSIGRVRIHDEVLTAEQIQNNYDFECPTYCPAPGNCVCDNCPTTEDFHLKGKTRYARRLRFSGFPAPTGLAATSPAGATISSAGLLEYNLPNTQVASFNVRVECTNSVGTAAFSWKVTLLDPPASTPGLAIAGDLLVDLHANHDSAGETVWLNKGTMADFQKVGEPVTEALGPVSSPAVTFNAGFTDDFYQCLESPLAGIVGPDPTRTIEAWVFNPAIPVEETILSWGQRGGGAGTNMSFNYGTSPDFGAIGHWAGPDIGWTSAGEAPVAEEWHHLVYTYDGTTTRVFADGVQTNSEVLGPGVINTHIDPPITLAGQIEPDGTTINVALKGSLSIGQVRIHDGVLDPSQVYNNFNAERDVYGVPPAEVQPPAFTNAPADDTFCEKDASYSFALQVTGVPPPTLELVQPAGATLSSGGLFSYTIPQPPPASFVVEVKATNPVDSVVASWTVTRENVGNGVQTAEDLIVSLDARDPTAGTEFWTNNGSIGDFVLVGAPEVVLKNGVKAVSFNENGRGGDAYQSLDDAPEGIVGIDPTRSIEAWVYNEPALVEEETIVSWGKRGGPAGTNMSFNYGTRPEFGAVGHWDAPDLGWNNGGGAPEAGKWHHLVYTYDGTTTRVYADGALSNSEVLGPGVINTAALTKITLASQIEADGLTLTPNLKGSLSIARLRVHEGVLSDCQVLGNYLAEVDEIIPPCPSPGDPNYADTHALSLVVTETGRPIGPTHTATATASDDTGDPILYTFTASNGVNPPRVVGPGTASEVGFALRGQPGPWTFTVTVTDRKDCSDLAEDATTTFPKPSTDPAFHRGDADDNGKLELTDAIRILNYLFTGGVAPACFDAADADDNGKLELTDAIRILNYLFTGGIPPAAPGPPTLPCGPDVNKEANDLGCVKYTHC